MEIIKRDEVNSLSLICGRKKIKDNHLSTFWFGLWVLGCTKSRLNSCSFPKFKKNHENSKYFLSKTIVKSVMNLSNLEKIA